MAYSDKEIEIRAKEMLGRELSQSEERLLRRVCSAAVTELEARLRNGIKSEDIGELFNDAAGVLALSLFIELGSGDINNIDSFTAGGLSVKLDSTRDKAAAKLRTRAEAMLASYLKYPDFAFTGVEG